MIRLRSCESRPSFGMAGALVKRENVTTEIDTHRQQGEDTGENAIDQPRMAQGSRKLGEMTKHAPSSPSEGTNSASTLILGGLPRDLGDGELLQISEPGNHIQSALEKDDSSGMETCLEGRKGGRQEKSYHDLV